MSRATFERSPSQAAEHNVIVALSGRDEDPLDYYFKRINSLGVLALVFELEYALSGTSNAEYARKPSTIPDYVRREIDGTHDATLLNATMDFKEGDLVKIVNRVRAQTHDHRRVIQAIPIVRPHDCEYLFSNIGSAVSRMIAERIVDVAPHQHRRYEPFAPSYIIANYGKPRLDVEVRGAAQKYDHQFAYLSPAEIPTTDKEYRTVGRNLETGLIIVLNAADFETSRGLKQHTFFLRDTNGEWLSEPVGQTKTAELIET